MARLVLIAHAATAATRVAAFPCDESVDEPGLAAVRSVTVRRHDTAVSSPARRCVQTATALGLRATIDHALRDCDVGRWQGRSFADIAAAAPHDVEAWLGDADAAPHGGETVREVCGRAGVWLRGHASSAGTVVAVTHPAVVRALIVATLGVDVAAFWRIDVSPLSETVLIGGGTRWNLRATGRPLASPVGGTLATRSTVDDVGRASRDEC
jgi:broad specificity phosphatase PhoE